MIQSSIFDITFHNHQGNQFSRAANLSVHKDKSKLRALVLSAIRFSGHEGMTSDEVERKLGLSHQTISARFTELKALGEIVPTGTHRSTQSGRSASCWRVK